LSGWRRCKNSIATIVGYAQMSTQEMDIATLHAYAQELHKESKTLSTMVTEHVMEGSWLGYGDPTLGFRPD